MELPVAVLQSVEEISRIFTLRSCEGPLSVEVVIVEASFINVAIELHYSLLFAAVFIFSFEVIICASFLSLPMQNVVLE
jgi:hypothetical protein